MENLIKVLLGLVNDKKISESDCVEIILAVMKDNIDVISNGISVKPIDPMSQKTAKELMKCGITMINTTGKTVEEANGCKHISLTKGNDSGSNELKRGK